MRSQFKITVLLVAITLITSSKVVLAQQTTAGDPIELQLPEVALIDTDHAPITLTLTTSNAGESIASSDSNSDMYVKVTSLVPAGTNRDISAKITGTVPTGTKLTLSSAAATAANSAGTLGSPVGSAITLSSSDQNIVTGIGSCYTGTGSTDGYQLTYTWALDNPSVNFGNLEANASTTITVYLTITAAQ